MNQNTKLEEEDINIIKQYIDNLKLPGFSNYIADISYSNTEIIFIEINPYEEQLSDGILFDWETDYDILFPTVLPTIPIYRCE